MTSDHNSPSPLTRESLYELVWCEPMVKVAARFCVSSSYMARVCAILNVPRPERGYWAKLAVGKAPPKPSLPEAPPGLSRKIIINGRAINLPLASPRKPSSSLKRKVKSDYERPQYHALIEDAHKHLKPGRYTHEMGYLKPDKRLLLDMSVTRETLDKALEFANELFLSFEESGHQVSLESKGQDLSRTVCDTLEVPKERHPYYHDNRWSPCRCTIVNVRGVLYGLTIVEMSEEVTARYVKGKYIREEDYRPKRSDGHTWTSTREFTTGRLRLQVYSPYWRVNWVSSWQETPKRDLTGKIKTIIRTLEKQAGAIARMVNEADERAEQERVEWAARQEQWRIEEAQRRAAQAREESLMELKKVIDSWGEVNRIEQFFREAEAQAAALDDDEQAHVHERLALAREMIGGLDALDFLRKWRSPDERLGE